MRLPPPPVPAKLREMLKDYPEHIERLQEVLHRIIDKPSHGVDPFDRAIWMLEGALEEFIHQARDELKAAEASGDAAAIERANQKLRLMFGARSSGKGMMDLSELWGYFEVNNGAFR